MIEVKPIIFKDFEVGQSPLAHLDPLTEKGNVGNYSEAQNIDIISKPGFLTQGAGLAKLTNGDETGVVTELINFIMQTAVADGQTYGIGNTKLFRITPTTVSSTTDWPHTITGATRGESVIYLKGALYYFIQNNIGKATGLAGTPTFTDDWGTTGTHGNTIALEDAPHPVACKEDIMLFGNGQYVGRYFANSDDLDVQKLDFGDDNEVADVVFHSNRWIIAVNAGVSGSNRSQGHIYLYDGSAISSLLDDEANVGLQRIGFLFLLDGIIYVAYQDLSTTNGYKIGYLAGRRIRPLGYFSGGLPSFRQKTLYKDTILFLGGNKIYSSGAVIDKLPVQLSHLATADYSTAGALSAPFGTPMIASTDGTHYRLSKFSGYSVSSYWKSIVVPLVYGRYLGHIDEVIVLTKEMGTDARCDLKLEYNQASETSDPQTISSTTKRRFVFPMDKGQVEDFRVYLDWSKGSASNACLIRQIQINYHLSKL